MTGAQPSSAVENKFRCLVRAPRHRESRRFVFLFFVFSPQPSPSEKSAAVTVGTRRSALSLRAIDRELMSIEERDTEVKARPPRGFRRGGWWWRRRPIRATLLTTNTVHSLYGDRKIGKNNSDKSLSGVSADIISRIYRQIPNRAKIKKQKSMLKRQKRITKKKLKLIQKKKITTRKWFLFKKRTNKMLSRD